MKYDTNKDDSLSVILSEDEKYNTSIYEQLDAIKKAYPNYDTAHARRTYFGWVVNKK